MSRCRSGDCEDEAEFYVKLEHHPKRGFPSEAWDGDWCLSHLVRVLALKLAIDMGIRDVLTVRRMR